MYIITYAILITLLVILSLGGIFSSGALDKLNTSVEESGKVKEVCLDGILFYNDSRSTIPVIDINNTFVNCEK